MDKTEFLETVEGKDVSVTSKPVDVVIDSGEHVEVVPYVRPPFVEPALIPVYTDRRKGKQLTMQNLSKLTQSYQK